MCESSTSPQSSGGRRIHLPGRGRRARRAPEESGASMHLAAVRLRQRVQQPANGRRCASGFRGEGGTDGPGVAPARHRRMRGPRIVARCRCPASLGVAHCCNCGCRASSLSLPTVAAPASSRAVAAPRPRRQQLSIPSWSVLSRPRERAAAYSRTHGSVNARQTDTCAYKGTLRVDIQLPLPLLSVGGPQDLRGDPDGRHT